METPRRIPKRVLMAGGAIAITALAFGIRFFAEWQRDEAAFGEPARNLPASRARLAEAGVLGSGDPFDYVGAELIGHYDTDAWRKGHFDEAQVAEAGTALLADPGELGRLTAIAQGPIDSRRPAYTTFLSRQTSVGTKRAADSVKRSVETAIAQGNTDQALYGLELLSAMQAAAIKSPSESSLVFWYGVNSDSMVLAERLIRETRLAPAQTARLRKILGSGGESISLTQLTQRMAAEMMDLGHNYRNLDDSELETLRFITAGRAVPQSQSPQMVLAMQGQLADVWSGLIALSTAESEPERAGMALDAEIEKIQLRTANIDSAYLVAAVPQNFEQYGRLISRIVAGKAIMQLVLAGNMEAVSKPSGYRVTTPPFRSKAGGIGGCSRGKPRDI